jgi:hypothetical protein
MKSALLPITKCCSPNFLSSLLFLAAFFAFFAAG